MQISVFKFGNTPLYIVDGVITRGIIYTKTSQGARWALVIFILSLTFFFGLLLYTSGRSYVAHMQYFLRTHYIMERIPLLSRFTDTRVFIGALLPLSPNRKKASFAITSPKEVVRQIISIPRLNLYAPIVETTLDEEILNANLEKGVVRWPSSATPGAGGATILLGHSSAPLSYRGDYGSVFALLDKLVPGDIISLDGQNGTLTYRVRDKIIIDPKRYQTDLAHTLKDESLVLVSCWPVGTSWQRIAVRADRVF